MLVNSPTPPADLSPDLSGWLDTQADAHLSRKRLLGRKVACLSQHQLRRLMCNDRRRAPALGPPGIPREADDLAFELHLRYLIEVAGLSSRQEACVRLTLEGLGCHTIARMTGRLPSAVLNSLRSACLRLRQAYKQGPYAGWYEVYVSEVTRRPMR